MSQASPAASGRSVASASASASEKNASLDAGGPSSDPAGAARPQLRSCVVCRSRKVRCDKQSPCSSCRRANITCVFPASERLPKWARRHQLIANEAASASQAMPPAEPEASHVMERLQNLESLVKKLTSRLDQGNEAPGSTGGSSKPDSPESAAYERDLRAQAEKPAPVATANMQKHFGRLVVQDSNQSRYVGSGFWSRVNDELDGLELGTWGLAAHDSDSSEDEGFAGTKLPDRTPLERHAFIFRHNLDMAAPDLRELRPLLSQIPFLLDVFADSVNYFSQVVHMPTVTKMVRGSRVTEGSTLTPANEALMFSIYYAAVTSMEPEDVLKNFGATQSELNLKYRLGLELALAKADFLNNPDLILVQAFVIFLCLLRRHENPRFVWMMAGVCIRMAQALGLHRDPSHFGHLTPYEAEMRRRVWWSLCTIDARASEDQGTDLSIVGGSFDTKFPLNINDADISPETTEMPAERQGATDISLALVWFRICEITRKMMSPGPKEEPPSLEDQSRMLDSIYEGMERNYLQYTESGNIVSWVAANITRLVISKIALFIYLPVLFSAPGERFSVEIRNKLLIAAIEVAEYNHLLNAEEDCRQWRWIFQTYTHWHATVYLLIEIARRPWSPIIERAWVALHSSWLIPSQPNMDKNLRIWVPLRKLMANAHRHREAELERLRGDPSALAAQELSDRNIPAPASHGPFPAEESERLFGEHWRSLFPSMQNLESQARSHQPAPYRQQDPWAGTSIDPAFIPGSPTRVPDGTSNEPGQAQTGAPAPSSYGTSSTAPANWLGGWATGPGLTPWLWADSDPTVEVFNDMDVNMEPVEDVNWYSWLESVQTMESNSDRTDGPGT